MDAASQLLRQTVAVLMRAAGDNQSTLAPALHLTQGQVSRKQAGKAQWTLTDCDRLAAHYRITVPQLLSGPATALAAAQPYLTARLLDTDPRPARSPAPSPVRPAGGPATSCRLLFDPTDQTWLVLVDDQPIADHDGLTPDDHPAACHWAGTVLADEGVIVQGWQADTTGSYTAYL